MINYEARRSKEEFFEWIDFWSMEKKTFENIKSVYEPNRDDKKIIEEAFPIYQYLKKFYINDDIFVQLSETNTNYDAKIYNKNDVLIETIEVTLATETDEHKFRLKALEGLSPIEYFTHCNSLDTLEKYSQTILERIIKKSEKNYPPDTTLIISISSNIILEDFSRFQVIVNEIKNKLPKNVFKNIVLLEEIGFCSCIF